MAGNQSIDIQLTLDDAQAQRAFDNIKDKANDSGGVFTLFAKNATMAIGAIGTAALALKKTFDLAFTGEQIIAVNRQFELLAESQGIAAQQLSESLVNVSKGLIDDEELLKTATESIVALGAEAKRLPEILELSRKTALAMGKDFEEVFKTMVNAIENGNAKQLKNLNIVLDQGEVYTKYASSLGLVANELTATQKQQALLNEVLKVGGDRLKNVDTEITPLANSLQRFKVSFGDSMDAVALSFNKAFGPAFSATLDMIREKFLKLAPNTVGEKLDDISLKIQNQKNDLLELESVLQRKQNVSGFVNSLKEAFSGSGSEQVIKNQINTLKNSIPELEKSYNALNFQRQQASDIAEMNAARVTKVEKKLTVEQLQAINQRKIQVQQAAFQLNQSAFQSTEQLLQFETDASKRRELLAQNTNAKLQFLEQETKIKLQEINKQYSNQAGFTDSQRESIRTAILTDAEAKRTLISAQGYEALTRNAERAKERIALVTSAVSAIVRGGAIALGESLTKAGNSFENFGKAIIGVIADQIVTLGQGLIVQGLALETFVTAINSLLPGSGAAAAAAGLGLVLFGTALKAAVGGGSGAKGGATDGGGVATGGGVSATPDAAIGDVANAQPQEPQTKIELNIQGDVLDSDQTGMRIVDLINSAFDKQGAVITSTV